MKNWKTTLLGILTILATLATAGINYLKTGTLPDIPATVAALGAGVSLIWAHDPKPTTETGTANNILSVLALCAVFSLSGCAWIQTHQTQIGETVAVIVERAATSLGSALLSAAVSPNDKDGKANYLDGVAGAFWEQPIVTSDDVSKIVNIWSPNDGEQWKNLASGLASMTSNVLTTYGKTYAATIGQNIATGLNTAAAQGRQDAATARAKMQEQSIAFAG